MKASIAEKAFHLPHVAILFWENIDPSRCVRKMTKIQENYLRRRPSLTPTISFPLRLVSPQKWHKCP